MGSDFINLYENILIHLYKIVENNDINIYKLTKIFSNEFLYLYDQINVNENNINENIYYDDNTQATIELIEKIFNTT